MAELRYNPLLDDWTMVSANRSNRPDMPKDYCPFCPGSGRVPDHYEVHNYDNDFPILSPHPPQMDPVGSEFYKTAPSYGKCDVILYSPDHHASLWELPLDHIEKLVDLWKTRYQEMSDDPKIRYIMPFENRGPEVGVTMPHPHGQIYGYSVIPLRLRTELANAREFYQKTGQNLFATIREEEHAFAQRILFQNDSFVVFLPFFSEYPYGPYILPLEDFYSFRDFDEKRKRDFADILKKTTGTFDSLFDSRFPYMMCVYNEPVNTPQYEDCHNYFLFHVKFFPPLRGKNSIKWNASSETGAWAAGNPRKVEETAQELREAYQRFIAKEESC